MRPHDTAEKSRRALVKLAGSRHQDFAATLSAFVRQRFLARLATSAHQRDLIVTGGMLLPAWLQPCRDTSNVDLFDLKKRDATTIAAVLAELCKSDAPADGLLYRSETLQLSQRQTLGGYRCHDATLQVTLATMHATLPVRIGFGYNLLPPPEPAALPNLLSETPTPVRGVTKELCIVEKLHALLTEGGVAQRPQDAYDIYQLVVTHPLAGSRFGAAFRQTFERRVTLMPQTLPDAWSPVLASNPLVAASWNALLRRNRLPSGEMILWGVMHTLSELCTPLIEAFARKHAFNAYQWAPGGPWQ